MYYRIGGLTLKVQADLPIMLSTFSEPIAKFRVRHSSTYHCVIYHKFLLPDVSQLRLGRVVYRKIPWAIYDQGEAYCYLGISDENSNQNFRQVAYFYKDHSLIEIYNRSEEAFLLGGNTSLLLFPTDQILLGRLLADHQSCIFHSAGMIMNGQGLLFAGHSGAGRSTIMTILQSQGEILCDDRNIVRRHAEGWRLYGTWSHGDISDVSPNSAPLKAILLLEQSDENRLIPIMDRREIVRILPFLIVKPLVTADWWEKTLDLVGQIAREVPVYRLRFQKSERVLDALQPLLC